MFNVTETGKRIKAIRGSMKQEECAEKIGISRAALSSYENGSRTMDIEILYKFSELFNVSTDYLLGRTPHSTTDEDEQNVLKVTGLSEKALENIRVLCGTSPTTWKSNLSHKAVMFMLESEQIIEIARKLGEVEAYQKILAPSPELIKAMLELEKTNPKEEILLAISAIVKNGNEGNIKNAMGEFAKELYDNYRKELENG